MQTYLFGGPVALADILAILEPGQNLLNNGLLFPRLLLLKTLAALAGLLLLVLERLLDELDVLQSQLLTDDIEITDGVDITLNVNNLSIVEATNDLEDSIDGANVRQEGVTKTSTGRGATGQAGNVVNCKVGGDLGLGLVLLAQPVEPRIGDDNARLFRIDGSVGEILLKEKSALGGPVRCGGVT